MSSTSDSGMTHLRVGLAAGGEGDLSLGADLADWPAPGESSCIELLGDSDGIELFELRRFLHRAARGLAVGGQALWRGRDPDAARGRDGILAPRDADRDRTVQSPRSLRTLVELVRLFPLSLGTPMSLGGGILQHRAWRIPAAGDAHRGGEDAQKYAPDTAWRRIDRREEPEVLDDLLYGLSALAVPRGGKVGALGVNDGRELDAWRMIGRDDLRLSGWDWSPEAIRRARERFPAHAERMHLADLGGRHPHLEGAPFDALLALNVLQCRSIDRDRILRDMESALAAGGGILISVPACRHGAEDLCRRPHSRSDLAADMAGIDKDLRFLVRHFHRQGFTSVRSFGTYDRFVLAQRKA